MGCVEVSVAQEAGGAAEQFVRVSDSCLNFLQNFACK